MENVNIKINGMPMSVPAGSTIIEACKLAGIDIPTLCYMKDMNEIGACRMCVVEVKGARSLVAACVYPVNEGMEVITNSPKVIESRKTTLELILSTHDRKCLSCSRSGKCELQTLCRELGVEDAARFDGDRPTYDIDATQWLVRDNNKCVLCRRCVAACQDQYAGVIGANARGFDTHIGCAFEQPLNSVACIACGQCIVNCPVGALREKDDTDRVFEALADPEKVVVVQTAPAVRAALGEEFGFEMGTNVEGKMVAALRRLGFDKVFDTDFGADLTIMEEAHEFLDRVQNGGVLPMITSCSPGWIKFCEHYYPDLIPHLSTCKSPQQMQGSMIKSYYAEKAGIDPKDIVVVSVMPCIAKKFETTGIGIEDLVSIGTIGLIKAVSTFDYTKGARFATYASRCIDNEILMTFRAAKKSAGDVYISEPVETDKDGNSLTLMDLIDDGIDIHEQVDTLIKSRQLYRFLGKCLDKREFDVIIYRYGLYGKKPHTQSQTAEHMNISRSYVSRIEKKAIEKLRRMYDTTPL